ncbi:MAG: type II toxin-antitoxin system Phd/YefM family antitoxin [Alphaproteobacteria bacterium]|nr:type II toxin-antitoxin system Phd/YefM family antitoxin [Alphaproteobacteria bacterium]
MRSFSSFDLQRNVAKVQEAALREPVAVSYHGRDRLVIMPIDEFERLKRRDKMVISMREIPEDFIAAMREPHVDAEQAALDPLMDEE